MKAKNVCGISYNRLWIYLSADGDNICPGLLHGQGLFLMKFFFELFEQNHSRTNKRQIRGRGMGQNGSKASSVFSTMFQVKKDHLESDDKLSFPASITRFIPRSPSMSGSSFRTCDASGNSSLRNSALTIRNSTFRNLTLNEQSQRKNSTSFTAPRPSLLVPPGDHFNLDHTTLSRLSSSDSSADADRPICPPSPRQSLANAISSVYYIICYHMNFT